MNGFIGAVHMNNTLAVRQLIESGFDVDTHLHGPLPSGLLIAARYGKPDIAQLLVENGADMLITSESGYTAMHFAADEGYVEVLRILVDNMPGPFILNAVDGVGQTPLYVAAVAGQENSIRLLLASGADEQIMAHGDRLPVDIALMQGHLRCAALLVEETERKAALEAERVDRIVAVLMGLDPRLGNRSRLRSLDESLVVMMLRNYII